ncbi:uncharacterized protein [Apostichopus japonicus]|uniref:uncharacterized protein n=1 Tax=Stichopus japonicus TaxID=307972 RepID=UPI003AB6D3AE
MGTHKKSKKARNRSRSRSRDSEYSEGHKGSKSKRSRRRRSSSRSSSSDSNKGDRYRSLSKSPDRRRKKKSKKSRSRSRERYAERQTTRRSRSRSVSGSRSTQRSRSPSRSKKRRRSRSRSRSSDRLSKLGSRSKETSKTASPLSFKDVKEASTVAEERPRESLQEKMQRALEAAATADAQLRQQGILTSMTKNEILTQKEERDRQKKLASIEKDSFHIQQFHSSAQGANSAKAQQPMFGISRDWNHDSAIFTTNNISDLQNAARYLDSVQPKRNGKLASDFLSASREEKEARWFLKLQALRKQRLEGKPLSGRRKEEAGRNGR